MNGFEIKILDFIQDHLRFGFLDDMMVLLKDFFEVDKIVDRTKIGNVDAVKITFSTSAREHILYFDKSLQDQYIQ